MGRIVAVENVSLDGVVQAPGRCDEDTRDGFAHGGWAVPYADGVLAERMAEHMTDPGPLLFGRRTYQDFHAYWPHQPEDDPFVAVLDGARKYVVSRTLTEPLPWRNSTLLPGEAAESVARLRAGVDRTDPVAGERPSTVVLLGSGQLLHTLIRHDLVDEYLLLTHPVVLGTGRRLFPGDGPLARLRLVDSVTSSTGVVLATYRREGAR